MNIPIIQDVAFESNPETERRFQVLKTKILSGDETERRDAILDAQEMFDEEILGWDSYETLKHLEKEMREQTRSILEP